MKELYARDPDQGFKISGGGEEDSFKTDAWMTFYIS